MIIRPLMRLERLREPLKQVVGQEHVKILFTRNLRSVQDVEEFANLIELSAGKSRGAGPVYHLMRWWLPEDRVTVEQMRDAGEMELKHLGLEEYQAIAVQFIDEDHSHLHIIVNRVHPRHGKMLDV